MIAIAIGIVILVMAWSIRKAFYYQADVWQEKIELVAKDSAVDLQEDYSILSKRVEDIKAKHDGKWFKMKDIDELMK